jgi:ubiquinone/menaquinone biosynthesis C-methylase UbiE
VNDASYTDAEFWNKAASYAEFAHPFTSWFAERAWEAAKVPGGAHVLDVATGVGALALVAAEAGATVLATDFSEGMVRLVASAEHPNIEARQMDGQALGLADGSFDAAFSMFGVMLFADWRKGLSEMARVVKSGGIGCIGTWKDRRGAATSLLIAQVIERLYPEVLQPDPAESMAALADTGRLTGEMERAGFTEVRVVEATHDFHVRPTMFAGDDQETQFSGPWQQLSPDQRGKVIEHIRGLRDLNGNVRVPSTALIAVGIKP